MPMMRAMMTESWSTRIWVENSWPARTDTSIQTAMTSCTSANPSASMRL